MINVEEVVGILRENDMDVEFETLDADMDLTDQGVDSLDMATILLALEERYHIKVPEEDLDEGKLATLNRIVGYVNERISP